MFAKIASPLHTNNVLAQDAVKFAEDAFTELGGEEKLENAKMSLIERLNGYGISVTEDESDSLVRAAYQTIKAKISADTVAVTAKS